MAVTSWRRAFAWLVASLLFCVVGSFRFLSLNGFPDDHYVSLAGAQQMLRGAWPSRDFVDLGAPLTYAVSAAAQALVGRGVYAEAVLMSVAFAVAAVITWRTAVHLTGSLTLGLAVVAIEVLVFPRTYSYPKMLVYASAALLIVQYTRRPSSSRLLWLAMFSALALLVRHDHGVYVGLACVAATAMMPPPAVPRLRAMGLFVAACVLLAAPYLAYLQATGGVVEHVARAMTFARLEVPRQRLSLDGIPLPWAWLLGMVWMAPVAAAAVALRRWRLGDAAARQSVSCIPPLVVLALVSNWGMIRDSLPVRLPDVIVPPTILLAWLASRAAADAGTRTWAHRAIGGVVLAATTAAAASMGATSEQLDRMGFFSRPDLLGSRFGERTRELQRPWAGRQAPSAAANAMAPFFEYARRCVREGDRLLVPGFLPEIGVLADRPFAGGQVWFMAGAVNTAADHRLVLQRLSRERVPLAVVRRPNYDLLAREFPELDRYVAGFEPVQEWPLGDDDIITLVANRRLASGVDDATGWPCFR